MTQKISGRGFEVYLPEKNERRMWSERVEMLSEAIFHGYLFVRTLLNSTIIVSLIKERYIFKVVEKKLQADDIVG